MARSNLSVHAVDSIMLGLPFQLEESKTWVRHFYVGQTIELTMFGISRAALLTPSELQAEKEQAARDAHETAEMNRHATATQVKEPASHETF